jgi:hypothetical protein
MLVLTATLSLSSLSFVCTLQADESDSSLASAPDNGHILLVLQVSGDEAGQLLEQRFVDELGMLLDDVPVELLRPAEDDFAALNLGSQIAGVRALMEHRGVVAAAWLETASDDRVLLYMVAVSPGRAVARLVEVPRAERFEVDLAMAARELLGTAFLFHQQENPAEVIEDDAVTQPQAEILEEAASEEESVLTLGIMGHLGGGIYGQSGPSLLAGGSLAFDVEIPNGFQVRFSIGLNGGFLDAGSSGLNTWQVSPGFGVLYLWNLGSVAMGPAIEAQLVWSRVNASVDRGPDQEFSHSWFSFLGLAELHWWITDIFGLTFAGGVGLTPEREKFERASTDATVLTTPFVSFEARLGIVLHFAKKGP